MLRYEHLGKAIDLKEALRTRKQLKKMVMALADKEERDSPVYLCLPSLTRAVLQPPLKAGGGSSSPGGGTPPPSAGGTTPRSPSGTGAAAGSARSTESLADLLEKFRAAKASARHASDWIKVVVYLELVRELQPDDAYVAQQLALATYKSEQPERVASLLRAKEILIPLSPETSSDAETVGLWGAIHKRLWDANSDRADLDRAIAAYERGFYLRHDYYNGINFAFLLDQRAMLGTGDEAIADRVLARRCRGAVLGICDELKAAGGAEGEAAFWVEATRIEALLGLGRTEESNIALAKLLAADPPPAPWMVGTLQDQLAKLGALLPQPA